MSNVLTVTFYRSKRSTARKEQFRFKISAENGEPLAHGEGYARRVDCERAVELLLGGVNYEIVLDKSWK